MFPFLFPVRVHERSFKRLCFEYRPFSHTSAGVGERKREKKGADLQRRERENEHGSRENSLSFKNVTVCDISALRLSSPIPDTENFFDEKNPPKMLNDNKCLQLNIIKAELLFALFTITLRCVQRLASYVRQMRWIHCKIVLFRFLWSSRHSSSFVAFFNYKFQWRK